MKKMGSVLVKIIIAVVFVYGTAYADLILRARQAYLEGEKYYRWYQNPSEKNAYAVRVYSSAQKRLEVLLSGGKITRDKYELELEKAATVKKTFLDESSIKYAYLWYQTGAELFTPPDSKWARLSKKKMTEAGEIWKKELSAKGIKYKDYMLD